MSKDTDNEHARRALAALSRTEPTKVSLVAATPGEQEHRQQLRATVTQLAVMHDLLNQAEQARRLAQLHTLKRLIAEMREAHEALAVGVRAMARAQGLSETEPTQGETP